MAAFDGQSVNLTHTTFNQLGRITSRVEPDLSSSWSYDPAGALGKLATASTGASDAAGYPGGCLYSYNYDSIARLTGTSVKRAGLENLDSKIRGFSA